MFNKKLKQNIKLIDERINDLMMELADAETEEEATSLLKVIDDLTETRGKLSGDKVNESYSKEIVGGLISITGIVLVLKHEKADIITTKAMSMATKLFRG